MLQLLSLVSADEEELPVSTTTTTSTLLVLSPQQASQIHRVFHSLSICIAKIMQFQGNSLLCAFFHLFGSGCDSLLMHALYDMRFTSTFHLSHSSPSPQLRVKKRFKPNESKKKKKKKKNDKSMVRTIIREGLQLIAEQINPDLLYIQLWHTFCSKDVEVLHAFTSEPRHIVELYLYHYGCYLLREKQQKPGMEITPTLQIISCIVASTHPDGLSCELLQKFKEN
jgi:hypothetical protein